MRVDPARYRQTLLDSITDDGLEELTLRLARGEYSHAHRTGKGKDAGIDVLSDFGQPPKRAWQAKNVKRRSRASTASPCVTPKRAGIRSSMKSASASSREPPR